MKKLLATLLTMGMVFSCSTAAFAANETVLTTTVPDVTYTLNIPVNQEIPFGATSTDIGNVTITNSNGFAHGKNIHVTLTYDDLKSNDVSTTIPYEVFACGETLAGREYSELQGPGAFLLFLGQSNGSCDENMRLWVEGDGQAYKNLALRVKINSTDWGKALAGEYSSTITFTAEVVSSQF